MPKNTESCCSDSIDAIDYKLHWNTVYTKNEVSKLGWYETESSPILQLISTCKLQKSDRMLVVGAGATTLIDSLIADDFTNLIANDISKDGLETLKKRIGEKSFLVEWLVDDLVHPQRLSHMHEVKLWIDRAVLHFFIDELDQNQYFKLLKEKVSENGFVILAEFNLSSATKCSGLPIKQYDSEILTKKLGTDFKLIQSFDYVYTMPNGDKRNYVYTLFSRINKKINAIN